MEIQTLEDYVKNFGNERAYEEWLTAYWRHYRGSKLTRREAQRAAFVECFPTLQLPDLPCE